MRNLIVISPQSDIGKLLLIVFIIHHWGKRLKSPHHFFIHKNIYNRRKYLFYTTLTIYHWLKSQHKFTRINKYNIHYEWNYFLIKASLSKYGKIIFVIVWTGIWLVYQPSMLNVQAMTIYKSIDSTGKY
jgi:hypothetical protein